ncbi:MAG: hypothetical protein WA823_10880 [Candidatus Acidiferrales bacterium]
MQVDHQHYREKGEEREGQVADDHDDEQEESKANNFGDLVGDLTTIAAAKKV